MMPEVRMRVMWNLERAFFLFERDDGVSYFFYLRKRNAEGSTYLSDFEKKLL